MCRFFLLLLQGLSLFGKLEVLVLHFDMLLHHNEELEHFPLVTDQDTIPISQRSTHLELLVLTSSEVADLGFKAVDLALQKITPLDVFLEDLSKFTIQRDTDTGWRRTPSISFALPPFSTSVSCHLVKRGSPAARIVSFRTITGTILANSATLSWGRKELQTKPSALKDNSAGATYQRLLA